MKNYINTVELGFHDDNEGSWLTAIISFEYLAEFKEAIAEPCTYIVGSDGMSQFSHGDVTCFTFDRTDTEVIGNIKADIEAGKYPYLTLI